MSGLRDFISNISRLLAVCLTAALLPVAAQPVAAQPVEGQPSLPLAIPSGVSVRHLFDDEVVADNTSHVCRLAVQMPPRERFAYLRRHVIPDDLRIRLGIAFSESNPVEPRLSNLSADRDTIDYGQRHQQNRIRTGGLLISPALELVRAAAESSQLHPLRDLVQSLTSSDEVQLRSRLALLALIDLTDGHPESAVDYVDEFYKRFLKQRMASLQGRIPETILLDFCVSRGLLPEESLLFLTSIVDTQIRAGRNHGPDAWNVYMVNLWGRARLLKQGISIKDQPWSSAPHLKQWQWVSRNHSWSSGLGLAAGHVTVDRGRAEFFGKRDDEYLLYVSPLRGNYSIECDCSGFGWREIHPFVAGVWMTPPWHHESIQIGEFFRVVGEVKLSPRLSRVDERLHWRVDVRDGVVSRYLNSRLLMRQTLPDHSDPWVIIRNQGTGTGKVQNVRIVGDPQIPHEVVLSELRTSTPQTGVSETRVQTSGDSAVRSGSPNSRVQAGAALPVSLPPATSPLTKLSGWLTWHEDPWTPEKSTWKICDRTGEPTQIVGHRLEGFSGAGRERLLRYQWPLIWDCDVHYEFYYSPGHHAVGPALGRLALLPNPQGVSIHWITNGLYESTDLDPLNQTAEGNTAAGVPLEEKAWNRATLSVQGNQLRLTVNEQPVYSGTIGITNDRSFGLFHFADQSEARVRNIVVRGNWPKQIPRIEDQELKGPSTETEDRERAALPESFDIDLTRLTPETLTDIMVPYGVGAGCVLAPSAAGLKLGATAMTRDFCNPGVIVLRQMEGDFDAIVEFSGLQQTVSSNGVGAIRMIVQLLESEPRAGNSRIRGPNNAAGIRQYTNHQFFHGVVQHPDTPLRGISQAEVTTYLNGQPKTDYRAIIADDCDSGRLRMIRKKNQLSYWIAPLDSPFFRSLYSSELPAETLSASRIFLNAFCYSTTDESSSVHVTWKKLSVRADKVIDVRSSILQTQESRTAK